MTEDMHMPDEERMPTAECMPIGEPMPTGERMPIGEPMAYGGHSPDATRVAASSDLRKHVHHSYIWLGGLSAAFWSIFVIAISVLGSLDSILEEDPVAASFVFAHTLIILIAGVVVLAVIVGICFGIRAIMYRNLYYVLTDSELGVHSGIISKKRVHVPYQKIQSIDLKSPLTLRIFGLCNVVIDTAGGASNKAVTIPYLQKGVAESLRNQLYSLKSQVAMNGSASTASVSNQAGNIFDIGDEAWQEFGGVFADEPAWTEASRFEYGLTNKEIFLTAISNSGGVMGGILGSLFLSICGLTPFLTYVIEDIADSYLLDGSQVFDDRVASMLGVIAPIVVGASIGLALIIWILAALGVCLQFGGFKARRRGSRIEVERGLLQHNAASLDIERVQSICIRQTFIRRLIGYCEISLGKVNAIEASTSQARSEAKTVSQSGFIIHPFVKVAKVPEILQGMVPEYACMPVESEKVAPVALRRGLIRRCIWQGGGFWLAVVTAFIQAMTHLIFEAQIVTDPLSDELGLDVGVLGAIDIVAVILYVIALMIFAIEICGTVLWFRDSRFGMDRRAVSLTNGGLSKSTVVLPKIKVQYGGTKANPLQRLARTATINAKTAAGIGGTQSSLIDVPEAVGDAWLQWLEPKAKVT